jgi:hypothetical protein
MCCSPHQVKWKDFVSDINLIPQTLDVERTGGLDLGIGTIPMPFATFKKSEWNENFVLARVEGKPFML